jgi:hypothetical protein
MSKAAQMTHVAGREVPRVYRVMNSRNDIHEMLANAIASSGATVLFSSPPDRAPVFLGMQTESGERLGVLCYPFRANRRLTVNRPPDEHRLQIRYGGEASWTEQEHPVAFDVAGVDTTIMVGAHVEAGIFVGLDPHSYDPMPLGVSVEFKDAHVEAIREHGWFVWERSVRSGSRRQRDDQATTETMIGFAPHRLVDFVRFERQAHSLGFDAPLRYRAAQQASQALGDTSTDDATHSLLTQFDLSSAQLIEIITKRARLTTAVKGGVAEHHLVSALATDPAVANVEELDLDGQPDCRVTMHSGEIVLVECKNVSPTPYADGTTKVEVQKTRSQKNDPGGRFYLPSQFDVVAACIYARTGAWEFRFKRSALLARHDGFPDRLAAVHRVDGSWWTSLADSISESSNPPES